MDRATFIEKLQSAKLNPIVKSVLMVKVSRAKNDEWARALDQIETIYSAIQSGDDTRIAEIKTKFSGIAAQLGFNSAAVDAMIDLVKGRNATHRGE